MPGCTEGKLCSLNNFWLAAIGPVNQQGVSYKYLKLKGPVAGGSDTASSDIGEFSIGVTDKNWFKLKPESFEIINHTQNNYFSFLYKNQQADGFVMYTDLIGQDSYDTWLKINRQSTLFRLEMYHKSKCRALIQSSELGGSRFEAGGSNISTEACITFATPAFAGIQIKHGTVEITANTSQVPAGSDVKLRNVGSITEKTHILADKDKLSLDLSALYINGFKYTPTQYSVCVNGTTKNLWFLVYDPSP